MRVLLIGMEELRMVPEFLRNATVEGRSLAVDATPPGGPVIERIRQGLDQYEIAILSTRSDPADISLVRGLASAIPVVILVASRVDAWFCVQSMRQCAWDYIEMKSRNGRDVYEQILESIADGCRAKQVREGSAAVKQLLSNFEALCDQYPGQWIACLEDRVLGHAASHEALVAALEGGERPSLLWRIPNPVKP